MSNDLHKKPKDERKKPSNEGLKILAYLIVKKVLTNSSFNKDRN